MKRKFKIINHQIEQLKEEISAKDLALVKEHFDHMKASSPSSWSRARSFAVLFPRAHAPCCGIQVEKEKESLRLELNKAKQQIKEADTAIASQKAEIEKLNHIINEADQVRIDGRHRCRRRQRGRVGLRGAQMPERSGHFRLEF